MKEIRECDVKMIMEDVAKRVQRFFQDKENKKEFEKWYLKEYGEEYVWKVGVK